MTKDTQHAHLPASLRFAIPTSLLLALSLLTVGYWGAWLIHPAAGLNVLGIDLAEYVKFISEVASGQIPLKREVFFAPLLSLALGLILLGTIQWRVLPRWLRIILVALAIPVALAMLPPAWTPALLRTPEFRTQVIYITLLLLAVITSPLLHRFLPDWLRGILFIFLGILPLQALMAFQSIIPALEKLYAQPVSPATAYYLVAAGGILMMAGGVLILVGVWRGRK